MPLTETNPVSEEHVGAFNPTAMISTGAITTLISPIRGRIVEVGFSPNSLVASTTTITVHTDDHALTTSNLVQVVSSTLGSFSSAVLYQGATASVIPATNAYVNRGSAIQITTSGNLAAVGAYVYAIIRRG